MTTMYCISQTPFTADLQIDEPALRGHLRRLIAARNGIYVGSPGAGEGHSLTLGEYRRLFDIAVDEVAGRVPLHCNPREARSAAAMLSVALQAVAAGVDVIQLYQLDGGHGMVPTVREQEAYWKELLDAVEHPVAISLYGHSPYSASVPFIVALCARYEQIVAINVMSGQKTHASFMELRDRLPDHVALNGSQGNLVQLLALGAVGFLGQENNLVPNLCQAIADGYEAGDMPTVARSAQMLQRLSSVIATFSESSGSARGIKMGLKALGLGNGAIRPPYQMPSDERIEALGTAIHEIGAWDLETSLQPRAAGSVAGADQ
jgi:dihydrodipicolinate synthase/N-acetylneuraminate lyase